MGTVLLLRHGRTGSNAGGTLAGRQPISIDDVGREQARRVGERIAAAKLPLAAVVSSPLPRCRETVALAVPAVEPIVDERLTECGYGDWTGKELKKLVKDPLWTVVQAHPSAMVFPGDEGESMAAMAARAVAAIRDWDAKLAAEHGPDAVWLACSHGDVLKAVIADALGLHLDQFQRIVVEPASITVIRYTPNRPFVVRVNDTGGDLAPFVPPRKAPRRTRRRTSDAAVGGGT